MDTYKTAVNDYKHGYNCASEHRTTHVRIYIYIYLYLYLYIYISIYIYICIYIFYVCDRVCIPTFFPLTGELINEAE